MIYEETLQKLKFENVTLHLFFTIIFEKILTLKPIGRLDL